METINAILEILFIAAFVVSWIACVVLGVKWAKQNRISPHWMWFGIHPAGAWVAYPIIRWGGAISRVDNKDVRWAAGKVACPSCGRFNSINNAYCAGCGKAIPKPLCPRCKSEKTRFMARTGNYLGLGIFLMILGASAVNFGEASLQGEATVGEALAVGFFVVTLLASLTSFSRLLSQNTKRVKCSSCGTESGIREVTVFQQ